MCRGREGTVRILLFFRGHDVSLHVTHTQPSKHTRRVSLRITVAFSGRCVQTMTGRQEPRHNEREQGPSLTHTHTHFYVHTQTQRAVGFTPSPSLSITQQAFSATLLHYSKLPRALSHLETCDCASVCVGGCGCLTEVEQERECACARVALKRVALKQWLEPSRGM